MNGTLLLGSSRGSDGDRRDECNIANDGDACKREKSGRAKRTCVIYKKEGGEEDNRVMGGD